jgi:DNA-binding response OmpR family regulator
MAKLLLVEDDPDISMVMAELLESEGHVVATASDGKLGLDAALLLNPDLIITDMMMPRMNGMDLISSLRRNGYRGKVVLYSSLDEGHITAQERGYDAYIRKPFRMHKFTALISGLLGNRVGTLPASIGYEQPHANPFEGQSDPAEGQLYR